MSLSVKLKQFKIARCKGEKLAKVEFRGVSHLTKILCDSGGDIIIVDQIFDWPVARPVEENELLVVELYTRNRLFSDKLLGSYTLVLQKAVRDGRVSVADSLLDPNSQPLPSYLSFMKPLQTALQETRLYTRPI